LSLNLYKNQIKIILQIIALNRQGGNRPQEELAHATQTTERARQQRRAQQKKQKQSQVREISTTCD
jgi:hypothetical protein